MRLRLHAATAVLALAACGAAQAQSDADPEPAGAGARVEFYGQAMLDAIYDARRMNPDWIATERPSQIPLSCPGSPGCGKEGAAVLSVRQSSLGFKSFLPTALGEIRTDLSFDLFGVDGGTRLHWLDAWAELGMFGAGQGYSNFMDIDVLPDTIDYWGPSGMVFVRTPQLRITPWRKDGQVFALSLESPGSAIDIGRIKRIDPALGAGITGWNKLPDLVGAYRLDGDWGHARVAGIVRQVGYHNTLSINGDPSGTRTGWGLNLSGAFKLSGKDTLNWQVAGGKGIASYMNDGGVDLAPDRALQAATVPSLGWLLYYGHRWNDKWTSAIGYSAHRQDNTGGQLPSAFHQGSYASLNLLYALTGNVTMGGELIWGRLQNNLRLSQDDYRIQFSTRASF